MEYDHREKFASPKYSVAFCSRNTFENVSVQLLSTSDRTARD